MPRTFTDLQNEVFFDEFDPNKTVNGLSYRTLVTNWINEAAQHISREVQLPQLELTQSTPVSAGVSTVALPGDIQVLTAVIGDSGRLHQVDISEIDDAEDSTGTPTQFAIYGSNLELYPTPSSSTTLTIRYEASLTDLTLTSGTSTLAFPDDFLDLLVHYARMRAFAMEDDFEASTFHQRWWEAGLARMRNQIQLRSRGHVRQIKGMMHDQHLRPRFQRPY